MESQPKLTRPQKTSKLVFTLLLESKWIKLNQTGKQDSIRACTTSLSNYQISPSFLVSLRGASGRGGKEGRRDTTSATKKVKWWGFRFPRDRLQFCYFLPFIQWHESILPAPLSLPLHHPASSSPATPPQQGADSSGGEKCLPRMKGLEGGTEERKNSGW